MFPHLALSFLGLPGHALALMLMVRKPALEVLLDYRATVLEMSSDARTVA